MERKKKIHKNTLSRKIVAVLISLLICLSGSVVAFAASGFTVEYRPGTADVVKNMPEAGIGTAGEVYTVSGLSPQREGFEFIEWVLEKEKERTYRVTYDLNGGYGYLPVDETEYRAGDSVFIPEDVNMLNIEHEDAWFTGFWSKEPTLPIDVDSYLEDPFLEHRGYYEIGTTFEMGNENVTLYAVYLEKRDW